MTRKHYERAVKHIADYSQSTHESTIISDVFIRFFREDNPKFDTDRFRERLTSELVKKGL